MRVVLGIESLAWPPLTGVGHYTRNLMLGLLDAPGVELMCMSDRRLVPPPRAPVSQADTDAARARLFGRAKRLGARIPGLKPARDSWREALVRRRTPGIRDAIYHEPNHILRPFAGRGVVTVHDLSVLHFPEYHPRDRVRWFERHFTRSAREADRIIVDSRFIGRDLEATLGIDPAKIRVVPLGVGREFRPMSALDARPVLERRGLIHGRYLLAVGTREPRKNLARLLDAYAALPADLRARHVLALVGPKGWRADALERRIATLERQGSVRSLGYVADAERPALYAGAAGFAYPSLYEGFGLPPLEAAACGTPVLTSAASPMAEMLEGVADLVDPADAAAIGAGLRRILTDPAARERADAGAAQAQDFTWNSCVSSTMAVYRELGAQGLP